MKIHHLGFLAFTLVGVTTFFFLFGIGHVAFAAPKGMFIGGKVTSMFQNMVCPTPLSPQAGTFHTVISAGGITPAVLFVPTGYPFNLIPRIGQSFLGFAMPGGCGISPGLRNFGVSRR